MDHGIRLSTVNINAPDPSAPGRVLRPAARLGGRARRRDWVVIGHGDDYVRVCFELDANYQRPVWPSEPGKPPIQMHLDIRVTDLEGAVAHAHASAVRVLAPTTSPRTTSASASTPPATPSACGWTSPAT